MLIIICSNGDPKDPVYHSAEVSFIQRILTQKGSTIPNDKQFKTFSNPNAKFPDVNNQFATQSYLTTLLHRIGVDPYKAQLSWKAELYKEFGYTFVIFFCTADNPTYSFNIKETPKGSGLKGFLQALFGKK